MPRHPDIQINVNANGVTDIKVYADTPGEREEGLQTLLRVSPEIQALEEAVTGGRVRTTLSKTEVEALG